MSLALQTSSFCSLRSPSPFEAADQRTGRWKVSSSSGSRRALRCAAAAAASGGGGEPPEQWRAQPRRRELLLRSSASALSWMLLAEMTSIGGDGRTIVNSLLGELACVGGRQLCACSRPARAPLSLPALPLPLLPGAYGLPQFKATPGLRPYDDPEEPYTFNYPKACAAASLPVLSSPSAAAAAIVLWPGRRKEAGGRA